MSLVTRKSFLGTEFLYTDHGLRVADHTFLRAGSTNRRITQADVSGSCWSLCGSPMPTRIQNHIFFKVLLLVISTRTYILLLQITQYFLSPRRARFEICIVNQVAISCYVTFQYQTHPRSFRMHRLREYKPFVFWSQCVLYFEYRQYLISHVLSLIKFSNYSVSNKLDQKKKCLRMFFDTIKWDRFFIRRFHVQLPKYIRSSSIQCAIRMSTLRLEPRSLVWRIFLF